MPGITLVEARKRANYLLAQQILQSSSETDNFYQFIRWEPVFGAADVHTYLRRKGKVPGRWRSPGEIITEFDNPLMSRVTTQLREMVNRTAIRQYVKTNMSNAWDQKQINRIELVKDMARDVARSAITGQFMDTAVIRPGGGLNGAALLAANTVVRPGPFYVDGMGDGLIQFDQPSGKLSFKAPQDSNYGEGQVIAAATTYTLKSDNDAYTITLTIGAVPGASGHSEVQFSSSTKQPDGLITLVDSTQTIASRGANGDAMSFDILDELVERMDKFDTVSETAFVMHTRQFRALKARGRGLGGARIEDKMFGENLSLPSYEGRPILTSKYIPDVVKGNAPTTHSVFCVNLNPERGYFGIAAGDETGEGIQSTEVPDGSPVFGFKIRDLGMSRDSNGEEEMVVWNGAFGMKAVQGAAQYTGVYDPN